MNTQHYVYALAIMAVGCERTPCGNLVVGGGELTMRITPSGGAPIEWSIPGVADLKDRAPLDGATVDLGPKPTDTIWVVATSVLDAADVPCGLGDLAMRSLLEFEVARNGNPRPGRFEMYVVEATDPSDPYFGDGLGGSDVLEIFADVPADDLTYDSRIAGSVTTQANLWGWQACPDLWKKEKSFVEDTATLELTWQFDPEIQDDRVELSTLGSCPRVMEGFFY